MFYSKSTQGFYDEAIHGSRLIERVTIDQATGETLARWTEPNPDSKIPADAVEITREQHAALITGQSQGKLIQIDASGFPVLADPPAQTLADLKATKTAAINVACQATIYAGFESFALGSAHTYPAKNLDQQNLSASVLASLMPGLPADWATPFWCKDAAGAWDFRLHTAPQIQQAGQDGKAAILAALVKNKTLADQVAAAATAEQVEAVAW